MLFSKRKGFVSVRDTIQKDSMDEPLRSGLWNAMHICIWKQIEYSRYEQYFEQANVYGLFQHYWHNYFKRPLDNLPHDIESAHRVVRKYFFECKWYEAYDFIEFTASYCPENMAPEFIKFCNHIFEKELSAYRFVDGVLTDITSEEEVASIEEAIDTSSKFSGVNQHLKRALALLSDRKQPDYRNSIKESISAVESLCKCLTEDDKATLGAALNRIEKSHQIHPAFKKALSNLYGFTNDSGGIRHALLEEDILTYVDAKFMLVSCSSFVNYMIGKAGEKN
ncbi:MAG TPA: hypothetical protein DEV85_12550 [Vibrio sp.]|uniref:AbiJ-NTD4 domain-containing protein n=1 Tax=Vibrio TaxID=662 RepID=UPI000B5C2636|nr:MULTISPECIES: hypothetical protein [Vibrio]HBV74788.1 hypothetical protein [Vibrio sp.]HCH02704.1 hypothetical protein [Vibrio sp.]